MAEVITIKYFEKTPHISQVLTGFCKSGVIRKYKLDVQDHSDDAQYPHKIAVLEVEFKGRILVYDVLDGYNDPEAIAYFLEKCDFYFKRSFSKNKNSELSLPCIEKMHPLGFNYHVSCCNHPYDKHAWKENIKKLLKRDYNGWCNTYYKTKRFEQKPKYKKDGFKVVFLTRLWQQEECLTGKENKEREYINEMRIEILRELKNLPEIDFVGGLSDNDLAREMAPDVIIEPEFTDRKNYLKLMKSSDICIGSMGLFESIGWKTGEYIAASKAIINEKLHYEVPGYFVNGKNYIEFSSAEECVNAVKELVKNPDRIYSMKLENNNYYNNFLRPDRLIENSLNIAGLL